MARSDYQPTKRGLQMLVSLYLTGDEEDYLKKMDPYQAGACGLQAPRVRAALIAHGLMAWSREAETLAGFYLTPRGRLIAAKHQRAARRALNGETPPSRRVTGLPTPGRMLRDDCAGTSL